jgi:hypothetical protein
MVMAASVVVMLHHTTAFEGRIFRARLPCIALLVDMTKGFRSKQIKAPSGAPWRATDLVLRRLKNGRFFENLH